MSKEKNKNTFRIGALLLVACLISSVMLSGTFAKYTSEYAGQDTALVARWSFTGNFDGQPLNGTNIDLPIWDHNYSTNIYEKYVGSVGGVAGEYYLIAPGIQGQFTVDFTYDADVDADLIFNFTKSGNAANLVPLQYSLASDFGTIYYSLDALENAIIDTTTNTTITGENGDYDITDTVASGPVAIKKTVYWRWPYDAGDHNPVAVATARQGLFTGSGADIVGTTVKEWTDADDVIAGNSSQAANRDSYVLSLQIKATQRVPGEFAITGTAQVASVLSGVPAGTATQQWQRSDTAGGTYVNIDTNGTGTTYTLVGADQGKYIRVVATGDGATYSGTRTSAPVGPIAAAPPAGD
jgi:hypothetical protein